jgi:SPP1 family predicted phage head-tail adaptor
MRAGRLRHLITIQHQVATTGELGEPAVAWTDFASDVWADVRPVSGRAYMEAKQAQSEVSHKVSIRFLSGVKADMRVVFEGRVFQIEAVLDFEERHKEMQLLCVERSGDGQN